MPDEHFGPVEDDEHLDDWYSGETEESPSVDAYEEDAVTVLEGFFDQNPRRVFYLRQLQVIHEKPYFHWVTARAVHRLVASGAVRHERRGIPRGNRIDLLWHRAHRYPRTQQRELVALVEQFSDPTLTRAVGWQGEALALDALTRNQFVIEGRETRSYGGRTWGRSAHDFDLICTRDGLAYGVEVKNKLQYMDWSEVVTKMLMAKFLGITPLFIVRMFPKDWMWRIRQAGGFALLFKYQLYPLTAAALARRIREELSLPVDAPRALQDGTAQRFVGWHARRVPSV